MRLFRNLVLVAAFFLAALLIYAHWIEPGWVREKRSDIQFGSLDSSTETLRIVHLTDLHLSSPVSIAYLSKVFQQATLQHPDLICLTGDFYTDKLPDKAAYAHALRILSECAPTFACPGNHDGGAWSYPRGGYPSTKELRGLLESANITLLENRTELRNIRGHSILIAGLGDLWAGQCSPETIQPALDTTSASLRILLTHNPDSKIRAKPLKWDLLLAGHTHGGQLWIPGFGAPFAPVRDKDFLNGLYEYDNRKIYVSPGVGNLHGLRINCRPEISILDLRF